MDKNKDRSPAYLRGAQRRREKLAAIAIAAGRDPHKVGQPSKGRTEDELREMRRIKSAKYRAANLEKMRAYHREYERERAAKLAVASGRTPGKMGPKPQPADEVKARKAARSKKNYHEAIDISRARAAKAARERRAARKAGTYAPKKVKLTDEQRRLTNVQLGQARRARLKAADGKWNISDLKVMRWRQNGICPICNRLLGEHGLSVDHWEPLVLGGSNDRENMRLTHGSCNFSKGGRHPDTLMQPYESLYIGERP